MFNVSFVNFEDKLYRIKRILKEEANPKIDLWKEWTGSDVVLKKENLLYFVELVPDLDIVEETT